jgi:HAMP domain-containing protein/HPt (histidine-containing phosphotransfer) domain-containing protein
MPIGAALIVSFIIFTILVFRLARSISKPIRELTAISEAIARGDFGGKIEISNSRGEMGAMTSSLGRVVDQLRMYISLHEQSEALLNIYSRLYEALYNRDRVIDVFEATIFIIADYFKITIASLIVLKDEIARFTARYTVEKGLWKSVDENNAVVFENHNQVVSLLAGRKYLYLNAAGITEQEIFFTSEESTSLCILPVRTSEILRGYFLIEGNKTTGPIIHNDDALIFISDTISYILTRKEAHPALVDRRFSEPPEQSENETETETGLAGKNEPEPDEPAVKLSLLEAARNVKGLDVDRGLSLIGDMEDQYGELLRISAKVFSEGIRKMQSQYAADLPGFAIEVHGMKSALYNIGATELGDAAKKLEFAAKGGDAALCREEYPVFEERLDALTRELAAVTRVEPGEAGEGSPEELGAALEKILEACRNYDAIQAEKIIAPFTALTWEPENIGADVDAVAEAVENIDYDEAEVRIAALQKKLREYKNNSMRYGTGI